MNKKVLIFDFDGTIADTFDSVLGIMNRLSKEYHFKKVESDEVELLKGMTAHEIMRYLHISMIKIPVLMTRVRRELRKEITLVKPITGMTEVLLQLKSSGQRMGILTSNSKENVTEFIRKNELVFDFISASSQYLGKRKRLKMVMASQGLQPDDVIYIGDEIRDVEAAKKVGIKVAAVTWGYNSRPALEACNPDYVITTPAELLRVLEKN